MFYGVCEESTVVAPPDLVRPIDAPSRGSERCSTVLALARDLVAWIRRSDGYPQPH